MVPSSSSKLPGTIAPAADNAEFLACSQGRPAARADAQRSLEAGEDKGSARAPAAHLLKPLPQTSAHSERRPPADAAAVPRRGQVAHASRPHLRRLGIAAALGARMPKLHLALE